MTPEEFADALEAVNTVFQKAFAEVIAAAKASGNSTPRMDVALNALQSAATAFDELNPDAPAPPVPPTPEP